ncbi:hypothetical protein E3P92_02021 [Wallemia ichthyophaga]|uniref:FUN14 domain-containing protein 1 n=2 Tax=Wallemia ichthyophaga TaxID=245174 RepID=A0A4T0JSQ0_WALIC|nr:FUN14 domain-containing protein 1 [Wallemia ichthyophaga EXF-994]TIA72050.1 hypothetical protein E3P91_02221 [Wallemia ichthyophaga]EOQ99825.1 FUN14 domain-containing protein 1 [Wallemia ichthyophaga EXF-994]TIA94043.1 hypothetical protein E3P97_00502 [Wallemia ichthyophaga]TIB04400.1 hypothetical protein E3P95_00310 [Wallemia ichthyophaga]TIB05460.1 hypothetical protein E3P94_00310 [Wallemia ichthyophaga]
MLKLSRCAQGFSKQAIPRSGRSYFPAIRYRSPQKSNFFTTAGAIGLTGSAVALDMHRNRLNCESNPESSQVAPSPANTSDEGVEDVPDSIVNYKHLGFGSVCGICCGIFLKKGAKILAFFVGGAFVFLQYMRSQGLIVVKWDKMSKRYNASLRRKLSDSSSQRGVTVATVWNKLVDFLTADFQSRATFVAGLGLGLRLG